MRFKFMRLLYPQQHLNSIYELNTDELRSLGIRGIIADMDNTLVPWNDRAVYPRLASWLARLKEEGFRLCIVSNNSRERGGQLALDLGIPAVWHAVKPVSYTHLGLPKSCRQQSKRRHKTCTYK